MISSSLHAGVFTSLSFIRSCRDSYNYCEFVCGIMAPGACLAIIG